MQQLSKMGAPTPLNLRPPLGGESERVGGDEEELEAGERGARELEEHVLQRLSCLESLESLSCLWKDIVSYILKGWAKIMIEQ